jgi:hypothetical protein
VTEIATWAISWGVFAKTGAAAKITIPATVTVPARIQVRESKRE